jgi:hypothetical protein
MNAPQLKAIYMPTPDQLVRNAKTRLIETDTLIRQQMYGYAKNAIIALAHDNIGGCRIPQSDKNCQSQKTTPHPTTITVLPVFCKEVFERFEGACSGV